MQFPINNLQLIPSLVSILKKLYLLQNHQNNYKIGFKRKLVTIYKQIFKLQRWRTICIIDLGALNTIQSMQIAWVQNYFQLTNSAVGDKRGRRNCEAPEWTNVIAFAVCYFFIAAAERKSICWASAQRTKSGDVRASMAPECAPAWPRPMNGEWANANHANGASQTAWGCLRLQNTRHTITLYFWTRSPNEPAFFYSSLYFVKRHSNLSGIL